MRELLVKFSVLMIMITIIVSSVLIPFALLVLLIELIVKYL